MYTRGPFYIRAPTCPGFRVEGACSTPRGWMGGGFGFRVLGFRSLVSVCGFRARSFGGSRVWVCVRVLV